MKQVHTSNHLTALGACATPAGNSMAPADHVGVPLAGREDRARVSTQADVVDEADELVCRGTFAWSVRRLPESA
jgi:hypothetical protein